MNLFEGFTGVLTNSLHFNLWAVFVHLPQQIITAMFFVVYDQSVYHERNDF
jgi:hypothetical protein